MVNQIYHKFKQYSGNYFSSLTNRADEIIKCFISLSSSSGPEPTCNGFSTDNSGDDYTQSPGRALMQCAAKNQTKRHFFGRCRIIQKKQKSACILLQKLILFPNSHYGCRLANLREDFSANK
jgi:hypothetical protein